MAFCCKSLNGALGQPDVLFADNLKIARVPMGITLATEGWRPFIERRRQAMVINLNQFRKKRRRAEAEAQAAENRVRFGRSKEERNRDEHERERVKKELEDKSLE